MSSTSKSKKRPAQQKEVQQSVNSLKQIRSSKNSVFLTVSEDSTPITLPSGAVSYLEQILEHMSKGENVSIVPESQRLTTQQAADFMNVSRPHVVKLMETGVLPFTKVGKHRRVDSRDLKSYYEKQQKRARKALGKLASQAQDLDMGY